MAPATRRKGGRTPEESDHFWTEWGAKGSILGGVTGLLAVTIAIWGLFQATGDNRSSGDSEPQTVSSSTHSTTSGGNCRTTDGTPTHCTVLGAGLPVAASPCDRDSALATLGIPDELSLDAVARTVGGDCVVFPGSIANAAGATAATLTEWTAEAVDPKWLQCAARVSATQSRMPEVACSTKHSVEYVGGWKVQTASEAATKAACTEEARRYTGMTFDSVNPKFRVITLSQDISGTPKYRCAVQSTSESTGTIYRSGGSN